MQKPPEKPQKKDSLPKHSPELRQMLRENLLMRRDLAEVKKAQGRAELPNGKPTFQAPQNTTPENSPQPSPDEAQGPSFEEAVKRLLETPPKKQSEIKTKKKDK